MYIKLKVKVNAKKELVKQLKDDCWEIAVREPAENNMANERIMAILHNRLRGKNIWIVKGHHSPSKIVEIN